MGDIARTGADSCFKMNLATWLSLLLGVISLATPALSSEPRVVCYYTNWSVYRPGTARFNPQNINPYLCTHLIYAFGGFTKDNTLKPFDKYQDIEKGGYAKFTGLKTYNKNLKTMLAIGGWNEGSSRFSPMVASRERRKEFVRNAIKFLRQNRFDGLDLDWEYPAFRDGGKPKDRENYARLVKELREEFDREAEKTNKPRLLLTMAVPAGIEYIQKGFDVKTLNTYLDWMNLLTYDYHSAFEPAVNHHAPLYPLEEPNEYSVDTELNIDYTIKFYLENGADRDKLVLGIPTYGRSYTLFNADAVEIGSPADGPGDQGDATREKGYLAYYEICEALKPKNKKRSISDEDSEEYAEEEEEKEEWTIMHPNPDAMGPVAFKGNQWVGFDDVDIVKKKAEYVAENGLGGIMFWSIDNDDFRGTCHSKPYPLIEAAKEAYVAKLGTTDTKFLTATEKPRTAGRPNRRRNKPKESSTTLKPSAKGSNKRSSTTPAWNVTPEPPTTPDPGADFKCKDEGFFPHPRDCKKYFWCLDSGPSNLGIVAHQFTCPSGLFFNKASDSCDFARNVLCKTPTTTSKPPTKATKAAKATQTTTTTTRKPVKLSTKNTALFRTTSTTTPEPEEEEYEEVEESFDEDAEDPKVIKELIDLIKKVGGVEQLEKQLHRAETLTASTDGGRTTPATFNKKLYQKVLERAKGNKFAGNNVSPNSRSGPQNLGIEPAADKKTQTFVSKDRSLNKERPQYTTIQRNRPSKAAEPLDSQESEAPVQSRARAVEPEVTGTTAKSLQYVNIRRARPTDAADDTASRNALFERAESYISVSEQPSSIDIASARRENQPEYVTIRRQRPTTEEATTVQYEEADSEVDLRETALEREISSQPQYTSIVRARSTTLSPPEPIETTVPPTKATTSIEEYSPEPTTVLSVQISSLLNSPSSAEENAAPETTVAQTTEAEVITTASSTTRRPAIRRRGSTTTTAAPASSTTQVSPRNYSFISRRRPTQNEISGSDKDIELSRRIRSTTPDSREVDSGTTRRFRSRYQTPTDDSATAAASPVVSPIARGQFRPRLNADEIISLTPVDVEPQFVPRQALSQRQERRFRGRTTAADSLDSEVSAATVEAQRPFVPRGRGRFGFSTSTTEAATTLETTEATPSPRRPTFARFSPRPFARASTPAPTTPEDTDADNIQSATQRAPPRLPFGRTRPVPSTTVSPVARRLPFRSRGTTPQSLFSEIDDDEPESKSDDIFLSESAIEEKEHEEEVQEIPKRRVVVKKLRTPLTTETSPTESIPIDESESGKRKFRIIRRRPVSTNATVETEVTTEAAVPQRIRKVIRKKINKIVDDEPEIIAKSIGSLESAKTTIAPATDAEINYGERRKVTVSIAKTPTTPSAEQVTETIVEDITEVIKEEKVITENNNDKETDKNEEIEITVVKEQKIEDGEQTQGNENTEEGKPEIVVESEQKAIDLSENKEISEAEPTTQAEEKLSETTTVSTTTLTSTARSRIPYRPNKRIFTSTTEAIPSSSKTFSRKFNPGVYTSPASVSTRAPPAFRPAGARRPAFSQFTRRPFTTARTTTRLEEEEEEEEYSDEDILGEEPENPPSFVPSGQLYSRKPDTDDEDLENGSEEEEYEEEPENPFVATTKSSFRPKVVNSNTFRTSTSTTELPKRFGTQNKTALYNRFLGNKPVNETKKRVQNVPQGYVAPDIKANETTEEQKKDISTNSPTTEYETTTDDDYLSMSDSTSTLRDSTNTETLSTVDAETSTFQMDVSTDDYLENTEQTTYYPTTQDATSNAQTIKLQNTVAYTNAITEKSKEATTSAPIIKTQFDKLFSVSRVVEVSSKLDKHRLNKDNKTTLIEEGQVMVEKKPVVDKIGEVSRFSFIKILENEIPIYLTKLGHVYPVDNPPDNLIRIDEARNARALTSYAEPLRENLVASESINEAYRHITKISKVTKNLDKPESEVERVPSDGFLSFINEDKKSETLQEDPLFAQWQFVPAAYENEQSNLNKEEKSLEVITPRTMRNDPSTLSLEGLFHTDMPITARKVSEDKNQPFVVYSSPVSQQEDVNIVKLEVLKPETGRSIITFAKGQEFNGGFTPEDGITKSPISVSIVPKTESVTEISSTTIPSTTTTTTTEAIKTSPLVEMLSTQTTETEETTTDESLTTVTVTEEATTVTVSPLEAKRAKYGFPRRPIIKTSNSTRYNVPRPTAKKANATVTGNLIKKVNKTTTFTPNKSRFAVARAQNVPVDIRKKINNRLTTRVFTTEAPRTTTERKLYFKPIRSTFRPAFVPRKNTQAQTARRPFPRRIKATTTTTTTTAAPTTTEEELEATTEDPDDIEADKRDAYEAAKKIKAAEASRKEAIASEKEAAAYNKEVAASKKEDEASKLEAEAFVREAAERNATGTTSRPNRRGTNRFKTRKEAIALRKEAAAIRQQAIASRKEAEVARKEVERNETSTEVEEPDIKVRGRRPSLIAGARRTERPAAAQAQPSRSFARRRSGGSASTTTAAPSNQANRRAFRIASRRRPTATTTTAIPTTTTTTTRSPITRSPTTPQTTTLVLESEEILQDIGDIDAIEDPTFQQRSAKNPSKIPRRPLINLKEDQNPSATNEDERKRQSKKYSSTFKQNQLADILKKSEEVTTEGITVVEDDVKNAIAIATHQLLAAPLPSTEYDSTRDTDYTSPKTEYTKTSTYEDFTTAFRPGPTQDFVQTTAGGAFIYDTPRETTVEYTTVDLTTRAKRPYSTTGYETTYDSRGSTDKSDIDTGKVTLDFPTTDSRGSNTPLFGRLSPTTFEAPKLSTLSRYPTTPVYQTVTNRYLPTTSVDFTETDSRTYSTPILTPRGFSSPNVIISGYTGVQRGGVKYGNDKYTTVSEVPENTAKYTTIPVEDSRSTRRFASEAKSTVGYTGSSPAGFYTREYLLESPITKTYDDEYQYISPTTPQPTRKVLRKKLQRRISTTLRPTTSTTIPVRSTTPTYVPEVTTKAPRPRQPSKPFDKVAKSEDKRTRKPVVNYDYYDDSAEKVALKYAEGTKVILHGKGSIECLDVGNFPHPSSCKKFISCARMEFGSLLGWEYVCPKGLSFDPVGGICNWSAGLGCDEKDD